MIKKLFIALLSSYMGLAGLSLPVYAHEPEYLEEKDELSFVTIVWTQSREEAKTDIDLEVGRTVVTAVNGRLSSESYVTYIPLGYSYTSKPQAISVNPSQKDHEVKIFVTRNMQDWWETLQKAPFNEDFPLCIEYPNEDLEKKISKNEFLMMDWLKNCNRCIFTSGKDFWKGRTIVPAQDINPYLKGWQTALSLKQKDLETIGYYDGKTYQPIAYRGTIWFEEHVNTKPDPIPAETPLPAGLTGVYRLYRPRSGEHFYTIQKSERDALHQSNCWLYEGRAWLAPEISNQSVYRLSNPNTKDHHFTIDKNEYDELVSKGWNGEGIGWYSADENNLPMYRLYNPNAKVGIHHYTLNLEERDALVRAGWKDEGVAWYGLKSE